MITISVSSGGMPRRDDVGSVQTGYPQIYLACQVDHKRARTTGSGLSPRDSTIFAHLDERRTLSPAALAP
ncbi:MAG TPA: hypothetical protein VJ813_19840 [Vicinamibacterales bacterium]|nr:hypothetical protein [Vicinamibacterales bacterium]